MTSTSDTMTAAPLIQWVIIESFSMKQYCYSEIVVCIEQVYERPEAHQSIAELRDHDRSWYDYHHILNFFRHLESASNIVCGQDLSRFLHAQSQQYLHSMAISMVSR